MISFRYHLVSIVAVFLALALGIVVGTTALNGPITKDLRNQLHDAEDERDALNAQVKALQAQREDAGQFATTYGAQLVAGSLSGQDVLVIEMPGATSEMEDGLSEQLTAARSVFDARTREINPSLLAEALSPATTTCPPPAASSETSACSAAPAYSRDARPPWAMTITVVLGVMSARSEVTMCSPANPPSTVVRSVPWPFPSRM